VAALVLTSAITLGVAAIALLNPLERRLRHQEVKSLTATAVSARSSFDDLTLDEAHPASPEMTRLARALERRTGARVAVFDGSGRRVVDTRPELPFGPVPSTADEDHPTGRVVAAQSAADEARVAIPLKIEEQRFVLVLRKPLDDVKSAANDVTRAFTAAALAGLGIAALVGFGFATYLVRRLRRLRDSTVEVAALGPDAPLPADDASDEVGDLTRSFRRMQERLRQQEETRRQFVATASHELRTPLASLQGMLELLEQDLQIDPPDLADAQQQVGRAESQSRRLGSLAADLLDLTRLDAEVDLRSEPVELGELCRAVAAEFDVRIAETGGRIDIDLEGGQSWAMGDPGMIARVVRILLDNALRYSPEGSAVSLRTANPDGLSEVIVEDEGPGIPEGERELIFERFRRGSNGTADTGFGLGLAIGRAMAERMGGQLALVRADGGATFALRLPVAVGSLTDPAAVS
jgi:signal transduction histidine kinase